MHPDNKDKRGMAELDHLLDSVNIEPYVLVAVLSCSSMNQRQLGKLLLLESQSMLHIPGTGL